MEPTPLQCNNAELVSWLMHVKICAKLEDY